MFRKRYLRYLRILHFFHFGIFNPALVSSGLCEQVLHFFPLWNAYLCLGSKDVSTASSLGIQHLVLAAQTYYSFPHLGLFKMNGRAVHMLLWEGLQLHQMPRLWQVHDSGPLVFFSLQEGTASWAHIPHCSTSLQGYSYSCHTTPKYQSLFCWLGFLQRWVNVHGWIALLHHSNSSRTHGNNWSLLYELRHFQIFCHLIICHADKVMNSTFAMMCFVMIDKRYEMSVSLCSPNKHKLVLFSNEKAVSSTTLST